LRWYWRSSRHCNDVLKCSIRKCINKSRACACVRACVCRRSSGEEGWAIYWLKKRASNGFMFDEINASTRSDFFNLEIRRGRDDLQQYSSPPFLFLSSFRLPKKHTVAQQRVTFIKIFSDHYSFLSPLFPETRFSVLSLPLSISHTHSLSLFLSFIHTLSLDPPPLQRIGRRNSFIVLSVWRLKTHWNRFFPLPLSSTLLPVTFIHIYIYIYNMCAAPYVCVYSIYPPVSNPSVAVAVVSGGKNFSIRLYTQYWNSLRVFSSVHKTWYYIIIYVCVWVCRVIGDVWDTQISQVCAVCLSKNPPRVMPPYSHC